ncbi:hypothetical protein C8J57DRAFT_1351274, partial [Mycena rebaudengoi]
MRHSPFLMLRRARFRRAILLLQNICDSGPKTAFRGRRNSCRELRKGWSSARSAPKMLGASVEMQSICRRPTAGVPTLDTSSSTPWGPPLSWLPLEDPNAAFGALLLLDAQQPGYVSSLEFQLYFFCNWLAEALRWFAAFSAALSLGRYVPRSSGGVLRLLFLFDIEV